MRLINVPLPPYYEGVVKQLYPKYPNVKKVEEDFIRDVLTVVAQGEDILFRYLAKDEEVSAACVDLYKQNKIRNIQLKEAECVKLKLDLIDFAGSEHLKSLRDTPHLTIEQKFEMILNLLNAMLEQIPQDQLDAMSALSAPSAPMSSTGPSAPQGGKLGMSSNVFNGFSYLFSMVNQMHRPKMAGMSGGTSVSRSVTPDHIYRELMANKIKISELVDSIWNRQWLEIFHIAKNLEIGFKLARTGKLVETEKIGSNMTYSKMRSLKDVRRANRFELATPEIFDRKIMNKSLRVTKFRSRMDKKQCLYALLDMSSSTEAYNRILFIKSMAIALAKKAVNDGGVFYSRWFNGGVKSLFSVKNPADYGGFLNYTLNTLEDGSTDIDFALKTAIRDVEKNVDGVDRADIIVITDGTQDISSIFAEDMLKIKRDKNIKFHFLFLEDSDYLKNSMRVGDTVQFLDTQNVEDLTHFKPELRNAL